MNIKDKTLCLVDGSGYIFRAFYALPSMLRPDGTDVNAVYGFTNMMMNLLKENLSSHLVVVFDAARKNFRNLIYPEYKANRRALPLELVPQFPLIREACDVLSVPRIEMEGYEADDLIATYARLATEQGWQVTVISADKDLMQLMTDQVSIYDPMKKKMLTATDVVNKFGVNANKVPDVQALMGDSTDNVPGAKGIGPKTAAELINTFGSLENLLQHLDEVKPDKRRDILIRDKQQVQISKRLVELDKKVPVPTDFQDFAIKSYNPQILISFLQQNNFQSLLKKIETSNPTDAIQPQPTQLPPEYHLLQTWQDVKNYLDKTTKQIALFPIQDQTLTLIGIALSTDITHGVYIPVSQENTSSTPDLFTPPTQGLTQSQLIEFLTPIFETHAIIKIGHDIKHLFHTLNMPSLPSTIEDIELMSYELDGSKHSHELYELASLFLDQSLITQETLCGSGRTKQSLSTLPADQILPYAAQQALAVLSLYIHLSNKLQNNEKTLEIYQDIDKPLLPILYHMEQAGVLVDKKHLQQMDISFTQKLSELVEQIYAEAGEEFNINSPVQLGNILYEKRGLSGGKRGANGHWITDVKVLETLAESGDALAKLLLIYRSLSKLKSTYIDALIALANKTPRIHTTFSLISTNTGRLASSNPNLQNIPIRSDEGKEIRQAFIAKPGYQLLAADYSQIELRLMAHVANVPKLKEAFMHNEDIHARTASQILHIPLEQITPDQRRQAKAVNFGIIYGISAFGLAANLGISREEAKQYIDSYFEQYPEIKTYMQKTQEFATSHGYVETPLGRKIYLTGLDNKATKAFALRAAINAPIQGGAADIIKMAMIRVQLALKQAKLDCTLLLQVHDELVFEVATKDVETAKSLIKTSMEKVVTLTVPLIVDINNGANWKQAH